MGTIFLSLQDRDKTKQKKQQRHMLLTGDTCGGHRTGNPSLLHFQSAAPPARKDKHTVPSVFSLQEYISPLTHTVPLSCGPVSTTGSGELSPVCVCVCPCVCWSQTNLTAVQLQQDGFEETLRPITDVTHFTILS